MYEPDKIRTVADIARVQAELRPDAVALVCDDLEITYAAFERLTNQCAHALINAGVRPGDRIACLTKNSAEFFVLWFGAVKARACLAPVNWRLAPPEVAFILQDAGAKLLVASRDFEAVVDMIVSDCPDLHRLIQVEPGHPRWPAFFDWIGAYPETDPGLQLQPDDDVIQLYTSGTTGLPKGVRLTSANFEQVFAAAAKGLWADFDAGKTVLVAMPTFHVSGTNVGLLGLLQGSRNVVLREINPVHLLEVLEQEQVAYAFLVPAVINMLLQTPGIETADVSKLERLFYGASPIAEEVLLKASERFSATFTQLYGLTETIGVGAMLPPEDHDPRRGKLRACGKQWEAAELRVVRPDGEIAEPGEVGEIQIRSKGVMKGYWNRPEATAQAIDAEGWFRSGDAGYFDDDGYLYIYDRVKDMIISGGENVYPAEVENALFSHFAVADAAVIGVPDSRWGEAVKAVVVLRPGMSVSAADLIAHCKKRIAGYKCPKSVDFIAVLPRNPSGKVLRRELRAPYWEGKQRQVG
ncbi:long-chain-fatty-acid--CoA ligase [Phenylobacterium montanum]|uniref:3-methylmercaptopropionyl-CoA ligase n=1 Tax=Phenylobacterium montanum TaxID=2823693 RepID=A0A975FZ77_9CAUL|nr:long-chain-fatty-acid--CoA ligase [Caulobacter sp. S6]QUD87985.1 long-chain-fatty-acid--CoA ligase [Caulobacter sp. S6]